MGVSVECHTTTAHILQICSNEKRHSSDDFLGVSMSQDFTFVFVYMDYTNKGFLDSFKKHISPVDCSDFTGSAIWANCLD